MMRPAALFRLWAAAVLTVSIVITATGAVASAWQEERGEHFIVFYQAGQQQLARDTMSRAASYYRSIAEGLGYTRYANFWQWDNRVKIYLYADQTEYVRATGRSEWSHGVADYKAKTISSYGGEQFLDSLLPHEIGHLIFRDYVGFKGEVPLWLDEGVAQWAEQRLKPERRTMMKALVQRNMLMPMSVLMTADVRAFREDPQQREPHLLVPQPGGGYFSVERFTAVKQFYIQAFSLVDFLIESEGPRQFAVFCRQLRDGKTLAEALRFAYPQRLRSSDDLEREWLRYVQAQ